MPVAVSHLPSSTSQPHSHTDTHWVLLPTSHTCLLGLHCGYSVQPGGWALLISQVDKLRFNFLCVPQLTSPGYSGHCMAKLGSCFLTPPTCPSHSASKWFPHPNHWELIPDGISGRQELVDAGWGTLPWHWKLGAPWDPKQRPAWW
jgi:hypothetical protein